MIGANKRYTDPWLHILSEKRNKLLSEKNHFKLSKSKCPRREGMTLSYYHWLMEILCVHLL